MQEQKCDACERIEQDIHSLNNRLSALEHRHGNVSEAFVKNDLGKADYDGHRKAHLAMIEQAKVVEGYKTDVTKKILEYAVVGAIALFLAGLVDWIKLHIK